MKTAKLEVGMEIVGHRREWGFSPQLRIEAVGSDWAIGRAENGTVFKIDLPDEFELVGHSSTRTTEGYAH